MFTIFFCQCRVCSLCMLLQSKVEQILYDALEVSFSFDQDIDEFWEYLKNELSTEEAKNAKITDEIEGLSREYVEDYSKLVNGIEGLSCSLELIESQVHDCNTSYCKLKNVKARIHEEWNFEVLISLFLCFFY
ncbi:uncharacterized protein [Nicotiana sylvestris]|uniref:Uncharacterized protein LOC104246888 isoform X1 n=1 Tax=Nicotiana sylvestris TaxID=4096 RepID=A0A1U7YAD9_NICSY|nr:PREDICTED: uncharacterized protein LOC104246888 isoform X1 [Nicotiana sylvestris]